MRRRAHRGAGAALSQSNNYQHVGRRLAGELRKKEPNGVLFADQWNNLDNAKAHYGSTGHGDLGADRAGKIDGFLAQSAPAANAGWHKPLFEGKAPGHRERLYADPHGFAMYELFKHGRPDRRPGDSITEGIGLGRVTPVIETAKVDDAFLIPDEEAVNGNLTTCWSKKACAPAARPARQYRRCESSSPNSSVPARPSSPILTDRQLRTLDQSCSANT